MKKWYVLFLLISASASVLAAPYPLGTMTCADMGTFASKAMSMRENGMKPEQAFAELESRTFKDPVERKNMETVLNMVFGGYGDNWTVESAGRVIRKDCEAGR